MSTLVTLPEADRAHVERELTRAARDAALGRLAADIAHDIANPLFAVIGLTELMLADPDSPPQERLEMIRQTGVDLKADLQDLLDFARARLDGDSRADLVAATTRAVRLVGHGRGKYVEIETHLPDEEVVVACSEALLVQAAVHVLGNAADEKRVDVHVTTDGVLRVDATQPAELDVIAASRIAADHGGSYEDGSLRLPLVR